MFYFKEIIKFLKNNIFKIVTGAVLISLIYVVVVGDSISIVKSTITEYSNVNIEEKAPGKDFEQVEEITNARPAHFFFYVELSNGQVFTNSSLIEQYILSPTIINAIYTTQNNSLGDIVAEHENSIKVVYNEAGKTKIIGVDKNDTTHVFELYVNVGHERENLVIAKSFYELLLNNEIPLLENKNIYIFQEPIIEELPNPGDTNEYKEESESFLKDRVILIAKEVIKEISLGLIIGIVTIIIIQFLKTLFTKELIYSFSYLTKEKDAFLLIENAKYTDKDLVHFLKIPNAKTKVVISENDIEVSSPRLKNILVNLIDSNIIKKIENIEELLDIDTVDQIIYVLEEGFTSRDWYKVQRRLDKFYDLPTTIVQINRK